MGFSLKKPKLYCEGCFKEIEASIFNRQKIVYDQRSRYIFHEGNCRYEKLVKLKGKPKLFYSFGNPIPMSRSEVIKLYREGKVTSKFGRFSDHFDRITKDKGNKRIERLVLEEAT